MNRILYVLLLLIISACASFKEKVGLVKEQPDEFQVISNPPLSVPADLINVPSPEDLESKKNIEHKANNKALTKGENLILQNLSK
jgi:hypothetical protein